MRLRRDEARCLTGRYQNAEFTAAWRDLNQPPIAVAFILDRTSVHQVFKGMS